MRYKSTAVYFFAAICFLILSFARFMNIPSLSVGMFIALCILDLNAPVLAVFLVLSCLIDFSWPTFIFYVVTATVFVGLWTLRKKNLKNIIKALAAAFTYASLIVIGICFKLNAIAVAVNVFLSLVYTYLCYSIGHPVIKNKLRYKLLDSELISGAIVLASLSYGLAEIPLAFPIGFVIFAICILISVKVFGSGGISVGLCFAIGYALSKGVELFGAFALMSLTALMFIPAPSVLSAVSLILSFIMYTFFFNVVPEPSWAYITALFAGGVIYMLIPRSIIKRIVEFFKPDDRKVLRSMINRNRVAAGLKLEAVGSVFGEMGLILGAGDGYISDGHIRELKDALIGRVCADCSRYELCKNSGVTESAGSIMELALKSGRAAVSDLPGIIKENCISIASLISVSDSLASSYTAKLNRIKNEDFAKKTVASQLKGIADIMDELSKREAEPLKFDDETERKLCEELTYRYVVTSEALVTGGSELSVMLTVLTETLDTDIIKSVLKKRFGVSFNVEKTENASVSGWTVVYASVRPKFDVVFSVSGCAKEEGELSGDTHSFIKIDKDRFLMAVCDGMGSGEKANDFSSSTISLIENFYKAGFSHKLVLNSVNSFLSLSSEEIYSAVDIAVVDLTSGIMDIIKIGSPTSYIKTQDSVLRVEGESLPIGVLEEMKPTVVTYPLKGGETVVLTSDGASDSFLGNGMADVISDSVKLPEPLCKAVVDAAIRNTGRPCDDITVAAFHIFEAV